MLTLTSNAATVIRSLKDQSELPEGSGLRIAASPEDTQSLQLAMAQEPTNEDAVVEDQGARVFLESTAATILDTMTLDADIDDQGSAQFFLGSQAEGDDAQPGDN